MFTKLVVLYSPCQLKLLSLQYSGYLSPANVTTEVKCVEMHHEALSEAIPEGAVHQNVYSGSRCQ